jgi:hypothetical protein
MILIISVQMATAERDSTKVRYSLGVTPSAVFNFMPALQLRHNLILTKALSIGLETGYILSHVHDNKRFTKGYRLRPQLNLKVINKKEYSLSLYSFYNYRYYESTLTRNEPRAGGAFVQKIIGDKKTILNGLGFGVDYGYNNLDGFLRKVNFGFGFGIGSIDNKYSDPLLAPTFIFFSFDQEGVTKIPILILHFSVQLF